MRDIVCKKELMALRQYIFPLFRFLSLTHYINLMMNTTNLLVFVVFKGEIIEVKGDSVKISKISPQEKKLIQNEENYDLSTLPEKLQSVLKKLSKASSIPSVDEKVQN